MSNSMPWWPVRFERERQVLSYVYRLPMCRLCYSVVIAAISDDSVANQLNGMITRGLGRQSSVAATERQSRFGWVVVVTRARAI